MTTSTPTATDLGADLIASLWTAPLQRVAKMLDSGPSKYITVLDTDDNDITLTYSHMRSHVTGSATYACPLAGADGRARALAVEIDEGGEAAVATALAAAQSCGVTAFAIACRGSGDHDGGHVWVLYDQDYDPARLKEQARQIVRAANLPDYTEVRPGATLPGENIRLPFGYHRRSRTHGTLLLQDGQRFDLDDPAQRDAGIAAVVALPRQQPEPPAPEPDDALFNPPPSREGRSKLPRRTLEYRLYGVAVGQRNKELHAAAQQYLWAGYTIDEARADLLPCARRDGEDDNKAEGTITSAYKSTKAATPIDLSDTVDYTAPSPAYTNGNSNGGAPPIPPTTGAPAAGAAPLKRGFVLQCFGEAEAGDAQLLAELYRGRLVYDHAAGAWYMFAQHIWTRCESPPRRIVWGAAAAAYLDLAADETRDLARITDPTAKRAAQEGIDALTERGKKLRGLSRINNVLTLAQELLGTRGDVWNAAPWLLSVQNGIIDLRTGLLRDGQPEDYINIVAPIIWKGLDEPSPRFACFLSEIMSDEPERVAFLLRLLGYSLNGLRTEHILPICCGPRGRNGKGTLFETILAVLGPYAIAGSNDVLITQGYERSAGSASPHLMSLRGRRLVVCSETKAAAQLDAPQVKRLTGGDTIRARALNENEVQFRPTHTLFLHTNNRPQAPADDDALWSRVLAIDFKLRFVDEPQAADERQRDPNLETALLTEASGILAALVRGHLDWQQNGLQPPASVKLARETYRLGESADPFLAECCVIKATAETESTVLYRAYKAWCARHGLKPKSQTWLGSELKKQFERGNDSISRRTIYIGVELGPGPAAPPDAPADETLSGDPSNPFGPRPNATNSPVETGDRNSRRQFASCPEQNSLMYSENLRSGFEGFEGFEDTNEPLPADYTGPGIWHGPEHEEFVFVVRCDGDRAVSLARAPGTTADPLSGEVVPGQFAYHLRAEVRPLSPGDPDYLKVCRLYGQDAPPRPGAVPDESLPDDLPAVPDVGELVDRLKAAAEARQARAGD